VSTRIVYSDLDGTMVGPRGCFFRTGDRSLTLTPARALLDLHAAGVALVLVSGRTRVQLVEACRIFGADGFVGELGTVLGWDGGREHEVLTGAMPTALAGTPYDAIVGAGVIARLVGRHPGRVEFHAPWHEQHEGDVMLRGRLDAGDVEAWLAGQGFGWLQLCDNGVLPLATPTTLDPGVLPAHVYHLMPRGLSKGYAVQLDLRRRGIDPADAVAVGDSASDLTMAPYVSRLWLTANGAKEPSVAAGAATLPNVRIADGELGLGWAQAIRDALDGQPS
jgi:hypothetical protein